MYLMVQPAKALRGNLAISEYQEVLLRMNDEKGKPVPTDALISAAERYNLMPSKVDRWVVQTACRLVSEGRIAADPALFAAPLFRPLGSRHSDVRPQVPRQAAPLGLSLTGSAAVRGRVSARLGAGGVNPSVGAVASAGLAA